MNKADRFFSAMAMLIGLGVIYMVIASKNEDKRIKETGAKAHAVVVDTAVTYNNPKSRDFNSFKDKSVWGIYQFKATDGQVYEVRASTSGAHVGQETTIYYNPAHPQTEYYLDSDAYGLYLGLAVGGFITLLGLFFFRRALR